MEDKTFTFTKEELQLRDELIREGAYRKAAIATIDKLCVLIDLPIDRALKELNRYAKYLVRTYDLRGEK